MFLLLFEFFLQFFSQEGAPFLLLLLLAHWLKIVTRNCPWSTPFIQVFVDAVTKVVRVKLWGLVCGKSFLTNVLFAVALLVFLASHECANRLILQQEGKVRWLRKDASGFCSNLTTFGFLYNARRRQVTFRYYVSLTFFCQMTSSYVGIAAVVDVDVSITWECNFALRQSFLDYTKLFCMKTVYSLAWN